MGTIPKVINYCWFGGNPKNELIEMCIESWKKYLPEYEIVEWNENNFDVNIIPYTKEAYEAKKWAFVSDYARLYIIYHHGGVYLDTDVEVLKNFDALVEKGGILSFENTSNKPNAKTVNTGIGFAAEAGNEVIKKMMEDYHRVHFTKNGKMNDVPCPVRNTKVLKRLGLVTDGSMQEIGGITVYPFEYFCGYDIANSHATITDHTYTIHHYSALWREPESLYIRIKYGKVIPFVQKIIGVERYDKIKKRIQG